MEPLRPHQLPRPISNDNGLPPFSIALPPAHSSRNTAAKFDSCFQVSCNVQISRPLLSLLNLLAEEFIICSICDTHGSAVIFARKGKSNPGPPALPPRRWGRVSQEGPPTLGEILWACVPRPEIYVVHYEFSFNVVLILLHLIFLNAYYNIYMPYCSTTVFKY